jgi:hypothetical protein
VQIKIIKVEVTLATAAELEVMLVVGMAQVVPEVTLGEEVTQTSTQLLLAVVATAAVLTPQLMVLEVVEASAS